MASTDNRRTVDADDIKDGSITPTEIASINNPKNNKLMVVDIASGKFRWARIKRGRILK